MSVLSMNQSSVEALEVDPASKQKEQGGGHITDNLLDVQKSDPVAKASPNPSRAPNKVIRNPLNPKSPKPRGIGKAALRSRPKKVVVTPGFMDCAGAPARGPGGPRRIAVAVTSSVNKHEGPSATRAVKAATTSLATPKTRAPRNSKAMIEIEKLRGEFEKFKESQIERMNHVASDFEDVMHLHAQNREFGRRLNLLEDRVTVPTVAAGRAQGNLAEIERRLTQKMNELRRELGEAVTSIEAAHARRRMPPTFGYTFDHRAQQGYRYPNPPQFENNFNRLHTPVYNNEDVDTPGTPVYN